MITYKDLSWQLKVGVVMGWLTLFVWILAFVAEYICQDWLGEEMSSVSHIAHETREIKIKEQVTIKNAKGKGLTFSLYCSIGDLK